MAIKWWSYDVLLSLWPFTVVRQEGNQPDHIQVLCIHVSVNSIIFTLFLMLYLRLARVVLFCKEAFRGAGRGGSKGLRNPCKI